MISSSNSQRQQAKVRLGNLATATVADLDDWLLGVRPGNYLYFKRHKDGTQTASSKHYTGLNTKPPRTSRLALRDMAIAMAQAHVNDQDSAVDAAAQALFNFCTKNGAQKGLQNYKALRTAVHDLRVALDARAALQVDRSVDETSHPSRGALDSTHEPSHASGPSQRRDRERVAGERAASQQRAIRSPWEYDNECRDLRANLTRSACAWRDYFKGIESGQHPDPLLQGGAMNLAKHLQKESAQGRASLLDLCLDWLAPTVDCPREAALSALESLIENGLLGLLPPEHSMQLIDEFVVAKFAVRLNSPGSF